MRFSAHVHRTMSTLSSSTPPRRPLSALHPTLQSALRKAAVAIRTSRSLIFLSGAGMGVDSGLPDFRGNSGFWRSYPPAQQLGLSFVELANPSWFDHDSTLAWGFYGHRHNLYRRTTPHRGYDIIQRWFAQRETDNIGAGFAVTSNVDSALQRAHFADDRILEIHGSIRHHQCIVPCDMTIWDAGADSDIPIDKETWRADAAHILRCPRCNGIARPNVLMFGDGYWIPDRTREQRKRFDKFVTASRTQPAGGNIAVIECGAGTDVPSIRSLSESLARYARTSFIRINPRQSFLSDRGTDHEYQPNDTTDAAVYETANAIGLPLTALEAITFIDELITSGE